MPEGIGAKERFERILAKRLWGRPMPPILRLEWDPRIDTAAVRLTDPVLVASPSYVEAMRDHLETLVEHEVMHVAPGGYPVSEYHEGRAIALAAMALNRDPRDRRLRHLFNWFADAVVNVSIARRGFGVAAWIKRAEELGLWKRDLGADAAYLSAVEEAISGGSCGGLCSIILSAASAAERRRLDEVDELFPEFAGALLPLLDELPRREPELFVIPPTPRGAAAYAAGAASVGLSDHAREVAAAARAAPEEVGRVARESIPREILGVVEDALAGARPVPVGVRRRPRPPIAPPLDVVGILSDDPTWWRSVSKVLGEGEEEREVGSDRRRIAILMDVSTSTLGRAAIPAPNRAAAIREVAAAMLAAASVMGWECHFFVFSDEAEYVGEGDAGLGAAILKEVGGGTRPSAAVEAVPEGFDGAVIISDCEFSPEEVENLRAMERSGIRIVLIDVGAGDSAEGALRVSEVGVSGAAVSALESLVCS